MTVSPVDLSHEAIRALVGRPAPVILEVGANDGTDTLEFLRSFPAPGTRVFCFECDPRAIAKWRKAVTDPRASLAEVALADVPGRRTFHQSGGSPRPGIEDWDMSGSLLRPTGHLAYSPWCKFEKTIEVPVTTLDGWLRLHAPAVDVVDFLWIDTQGAERYVFEGAPLTLANTRYVKTECHHGEMYEGQWNEAMLREFFAGWTCLGRWGDDLLFRNNRLEMAR